MGVPIRYNIRSLLERKATTAMTAFGIALTVAVLVITLALISGLRATFAASGHPLQAVVVRKGLTSELASSITQEAVNEIRALPQLQRNADGQPLASPEIVSVINLVSVDSPSGMNVGVRGLLPVGGEMRGIRIQSGRMFSPGQRELIVGAGIAKRYPTAQIGSKLRFGRGDWIVVGVFSGSDNASAIASEIWCDLNQFRADLDRQGGVSSLLVRAQSTGALENLITSIDTNRRLNASALNQTQYYASMTKSGAPLEVLGFMIATVMAIGSGFGAMNTMYAAVSRRSREIATLRALGFTRGSILRSFIAESVALSLFGGILGCILALPVNNMTTGVGNFDTFSEIAFNFTITPTIMLYGLTFAGVIGAAGGYLPARSAARRDLITTLREG